MCLLDAGGKIFPAMALTRCASSGQFVLNHKLMIGFELIMGFLNPKP